MAEEFKSELRATKDDLAKSYGARKAAYDANSWRGWGWVALAFVFFVTALGRDYPLPGYEVLAACVAVVMASRVAIKRLPT